MLSPSYCLIVLCVCVTVTNDTVKVEIWDVVDKGRAPQKGRGSKGMLKMFNSPGVEEEGENGQTLDASFLDVYKGAHGVVFTFDITKQWYEGIDSGSLNPPPQ